MVSAFSFRTNHRHQQKTGRNRQSPSRQIANEVTDTLSDPLPFSQHLNLLSFSSPFTLNPSDALCLSAVLPLSPLTYDSLLSYLTLHGTFFFFFFFYLRPASVLNSLSTQSFWRPSRPFLFPRLLSVLKLSRVSDSISVAWRGQRLILPTPLPSLLSAGLHRSDWTLSLSFSCSLSRLSSTWGRRFLA